MNFDCTCGLKEVEEVEEVLRFLKHILLQGLTSSFLSSRSLRDMSSVGNVLLGCFSVVVIDLCPIKHSYISLVTDSSCVF